jgi:hypothetical protein
MLPLIFLDIRSYNLNKVLLINIAKRALFDAKNFKKVLFSLFEQ